MITYFGPAPAGLLQFLATPLPEGMIRPAVEEAYVTVEEEAGEIRLLVARAQGLLGRVMVGYRTVSFTAHSPEDYEVILYFYYFIISFECSRLDLRDSVSNI